MRIELDGWRLYPTVRPLAAFAICLLGFAGASAGQASEPASDVYEGSAVCSDGPRYYRVSLEPGDRSARAVVDVLDGPGGLAWARGFATYGVSFGKTLHSTVSHWHVRPYEQPELPIRFDIAEDRETLVSGPYGACQGLTLRRAPREARVGDVASATALPPVFVGTIGCDGNRPVYAIRLTLSARGERSVEGDLTFKQHPDGQPTGGGRFTVFGEFDPERGALTLIGDRWIEQAGPRDRTFDFVAELRDRGQRLVGNATWTTCKLLDLAVPGTGPAARVSRPLAPRPIMEWDDASACVTLSKWASQAVPQIGGQSFYSGIQISQARKVAIGLFADDRFVPFFGKPFESLSDEERKHVGDIADYCVRLFAFASTMNHSGASLFIDDFFSGRRPELGLAATRFRLLQGRLAEEMAALEPQAVGEADIPALQARLSELDQRFAELWDVDLAEARALIESKIEVARGHMAARLETEIGALPTDWSTLDRERALREEIARLGETRQADRDRLSAFLDDRLRLAADRILLALARDLEPPEPTLATAQQLRSRLNPVWPRLQPHAMADGDGLRSLVDVAEAIAQGAFPGFEARVRELMSGAGGFEDREARYRSVVGVFHDVVPVAPPLSPAFAEYERLVASMAPVITLDDLVATNGSPTDFGLKLAVADWLELSWAMIFATLPYDLGFITRTLRVSAVRKQRCDEAPEGGYWCDYDLRVDGSVPFLDILSLVPYRARFALRGERWALVETGGDPRPAQIVEPYESRNYFSDPIVPWEDVFADP